jgi:hypothetical protein
MGGMLMNDFACGVLVMALPCARCKGPLKGHRQRQDGGKQQTRELLEHGAILP